MLAEVVAVLRREACVEGRLPEEVREVPVRFVEEGARQEGERAVRVKGLVDAPPGDPEAPGTASDPELDVRSPCAVPDLPAEERREARYPETRDRLPVPREPRPDLVAKGVRDALVGVHEEDPVVRGERESAVARRDVPLPRDLLDAGAGPPGDLLRSVGRARVGHEDLLRPAHRREGRRKPVVLVLDEKDDREGRRHGVRIVDPAILPPGPLRILALDLGAGWRGGQKQTALVAAALAARGHDVTLLAGEGSRLAREAAERGLAVVPAPGRGEVSPRLLAAVGRASRRPRPDVLWASDGRGHGAAVWSLAAMRIPLVVHRRVAFPPGRDPFSRLKYRAARRFAAISGHVARVLAEAGVPANQIAVVPDGLPPEAFVDAPPASPPPFHLVHAGAFDGLKGQEVAVRVLSQLVAMGLEVTLTLLGDGPRRAETQRLAGEAGVLSRCRFAGEVEDVPARLAASHLLLLPSRSEGASLVLAEAMAAGCPVLAHDLPAVREVSVGASGRLLGSLDPSVWADETARLLADGPERLRLVAAGRKVAAERTLAASVDRLETVLETA